MKGRHGIAVLRKLLIVGVLIWTLVASILRALRLPNDFAEALWVLDYRFGFVKRGLVGTMVSAVTHWTGHAVSVDLIRILSGSAFVSFACLLLWLSLRIISRSGWSTASVLVTLVFLSSPYVVISAHLVGYFDNLVVLLMVASIISLVRGQPWLAAALQSAALLIHETALVLALPLLVLAWALTHAKSGYRCLGLRALLPLAAPVCVFAVLVLAQGFLVVNDYEERLALHFAQFSFIAEGRDVLVPQWVTTGLWEHLNEQSPKFFARVCSTSMYGLILPSFFAIICYTTSTYRIRNTSVELVLLFAVCLIPQCLHLVAWDTPRIWSYMIISSFASLWIYSEMVSPRDGSGAILLLCMMAVVINVLVRTPLMDGVAERFYLVARLQLYSPMIAAVLLLICIDNRPSVCKLLSIQGRSLSGLGVKGLDQHATNGEKEDDR